MSDKDAGKWDLPSKTEGNDLPSYLVDKSLNVFGKSALKVLYLAETSPNEAFRKISRYKNDFHRIFRKELIASGCGIPLTETFDFADVSNPRDIESKLKILDGKVDLVVFITAGDKAMYAEFRSQVDRNFGQKAIVLRYDKVASKRVEWGDRGPFKMNWGWIKLLALKIHLKWSANQRVDFSKMFPAKSPVNDTIIIGADVTHPGPSAKPRGDSEKQVPFYSAKSIAGIVGTMGPGAVKTMMYGASARMLEARTEVSSFPSMF
jgi:hypothetical protein